MREEIINLKNLAIGRITDTDDLAELEAVKIDYLGRKGKINALLSNLKKADPGERKDLGQLINETKQTIVATLERKLQDSLPKSSENFDPTIPGIKPKIGHLHPTTIVIKEMFDIFGHLGFSIMEGPEIETDDYNFGKLNLPHDHPARSLQDVLYIDEPEILLRSHTSSVESRALDNLKQPFRIVVAGKCYRYESVNASNNAMFYQFQGVALQAGISMADLKGTLYYFAKSFFGRERKIRFRCKYYPEVEPGGGLDIDCIFCKQTGCAVCKGRGWLEMLGCGMIHPNILSNFSLDPKKISGFAFGMGLDRIVMDRFGIKDIRSLYNGDIKY
ncbi:MAG: hypothetical protein ACD_57C00074G0001 [uncultured bacterium]|uniref:Phenylalanine--tRNA ligase alpha subunit n=1 Tax=Candidatus Woesebacteria bacterium RIFCSPHIGHO2_12_FULL_41_24 TaxID=1802510 RepID=A0A1F8AR20_9BACT|nr:MAG: hypothetical protein ACD_57C00074G0001 [uncultured bacterium]OGM13357.1 MAG: phenylalanine--tRNA ligase subunit alpha [Candidatus Woesebacteria bacterium RBG_16_41_13]OGM30931.1 MAG: phenylalanine--tRNA ligase subunit alpha [Candidatus Woesebacteria bacterium RIFCSPHIGHO2_01_FULL_42_80]OGM35900.1 MAG: phenylalanine--tRNA ligase subunit alpha [Candidatus Woesebacteria bacterium RIFCSPHIGHO2_02_FULL_42_20]OGM54207.1 MAG: phenylalanine--tRNA ligase subunit alpha [Candidatus Woesebacteria b